MPLRQKAPGSPVTGGPGQYWSETRVCLGQVGVVVVLCILVVVEQVVVVVAVSCG